VIQHETSRSSTPSQSRLRGLGVIGRIISKILNTHTKYVSEVLSVNASSNLEGSNVASIEDAAARCPLHDSSRNDSKGESSSVIARNRVENDIIPGTRQGRSGSSWSFGRLQSLSGKAEQRGLLFAKVIKPKKEVGHSLT